MKNYPGFHLYDGSRGFFCNMQPIYPLWRLRYWDGVQSMTLWKILPK